VSRALVYLGSRSQFGMKFGLETIRAVLEKLGHPEKAYPTLVVAGTNGKGSVAAYVDAGLRASGLRTGRYTSPHLVRVNERITVNGRPITDPALARSVMRVRDAAEALVRSRRLRAHPTYFEVLTAAALDHFRRRKVDVAVLEVGMGGRLDATNAADPLASAIVSVDYDHQAYLGKTLGRIAAEKAGVLRRGRPTVLGPMAPAARRAIARGARATGARLVEAQRAVALRERAGALDVRTPRRLYRGLTSLPGAHQRTNLVVALRLLEEARRAGLRFDLVRASRGIASTRWPGRLQWVGGDPPLLLDGAHNPAGARALGAYLQGRGPFVLLFGAMGDKDVRALAEALFPLADEVVLTRPRVARALGPRLLARRAGRFGRGARSVSDPRRALALARRLARRLGPGRPVVVAGSLYLIGEVTALLPPRYRP
jgi:dihydrofolate synthase/folylpolyglutamate synthase